MSFRSSSLSESERSRPRSFGSFVKPPDSLGLTSGFSLPASPPLLALSSSSVITSRLARLDVWILLAGLAPLVGAQFLLGDHLPLDTD